MIAVRVLTKKIGQQKILRGIDLEVSTGETLAIIGRSGGGKSVLLKHLVGLMQPDTGEIWIDNQNIVQVAAGGGTRIAVSTAVCESPCPAEAIAHLISTLNAPPPPGSSRGLDGLCATPSNK